MQIDFIKMVMIKTSEKETANFLFKQINEIECYWL